MNITAVIPARGGSRIVPHKNLQTLKGKTLLELAVKQAQESKHITNVIVSTDDDEIAEVATNCEAQVMRRDPALAQWHVDVWDALRSVAKTHKVENRLPDLFVEIHTTYPLRKEGLIDQVIGHALASGKPLTLVASPVYDKIWRKSKDGYKRLANDIKIAVRQKQEHLYRTHYGLVNVYNQEAALSASIPFDMNPDLFIIPDGYDTIDINYPIDLELIRALKEKE